MIFFRYIILCGLIVNSLSCIEGNNNKFNKNILGEWSYIKIEGSKDKTEELFYWNKCGFSFFKDGVCENKTGYLKVIDNGEIRGKRIHFLGNITKYKINGNELKIYNLFDSTWTKYKLLLVTRDSLILENKDSLLIKFTKKKYNIKPEEKYDKIIVSSSGCFGSCPVSDVCIEKTGKMYYSGQRYNTQDGLFSTQISQKLFHEIQNNFKKSGIDTLKTNYAVGWTDDQTITVTFVKGNKIHKTISDYGGQAPNEFYWAYTPVRYLYQKTKLFRFNTDRPILTNGIINFENQQKICQLSKSESFYLLTEIYQGKEIKLPFEEKYKIEFWNEEDKLHITTDGRFYKFITKNKVTKTIDLGYNFLTVNDLVERFRVKRRLLRNY